MSITFDEYFKSHSEDTFEFPKEIALGSLMEYEANKEILDSFEFFLDYYTALKDVVCSSDRVEYYLKDFGGRHFGAIVLQVHSDIHYGKMAVASILWIPNAYRGDPEVTKTIVSIFKKFCKEYGVRYYKRVSKITPYIHKHIVKEVK